MRMQKQQQKEEEKESHKPSYMYLTSLTLDTSRGEEWVLFINLAFSDLSIYLSILVSFVKLP
jgi:hypothetical protein